MTAGELFTDARPVARMRGSLDFQIRVLDDLAASALMNSASAWIRAVIVRVLRLFGPAILDIRRRAFQARCRRWSNGQTPLAAFDPKRLYARTIFFPAVIEHFETERDRPQSGRAFLP
jgi:hypothetical protein